MERKVLEREIEGEREERKREEILKIICLFVCVYRVRRSNRIGDCGVE